MSAANNPKAVAGDNSGESQKIAGDELRSILERIERLDEEAAGLREDRKEVMSEAKGRGFDTKTIRRLLALRKKDQSERQEEQAILQLYADALGMPNVFL